MSWLQEHFESFVKPYLGYIPEGKSTYFTQNEMTIIKNTWRSAKAKAENKTILLAGRDVFIYEILARRENYPTLFLPECSRHTVSYIKLPPGDFFLIDTGFVGTIPRMLGLDSFSLLSYIDRFNKEKQIFPKMSGSRSLALKIERTPKYWGAGYERDKKVLQDYSKREEFIQAALLTREVYTNSSPSFVNTKSPLKGLSYGNYKGIAL